MIKLVYCLRRLPRLSREEFQRYWRETHGPLVRGHAQAARIQRYGPVPPRAPPLNAALRQGRGGLEPYDGVAELWWESAEELAAVMATPEGQKAAQELLDDERRFIDLERSALWIAEEHAVFEA